MSIKIKVAMKKKILSKQFLITTKPYRKHKLTPHPDLFGNLAYKLSKQYLTDDDIYHGLIGEKEVGYFNNRYPIFFAIDIDDHLQGKNFNQLY